MKSKLLADRLANATASLIGPITSEINPDDKSKAIDSILQSLHARYIKLFSAGLKFKAATAATDSRYEFVLEVPGTLAGEQSQEQALGSPFTTRDRFRLRGTRPAWFHASLRVYDAGPANWLNPQADAIIQTDNFVPGISKVNCPCIYQKDILIERSDIEDNTSSLQKHTTVGTSGRQVLSTPLHFQLSSPNARLQSRGEMEAGLGQRMDQSFQYVPPNSSNRELDLSQATYTPTRKVVLPHSQVENYNRRQSELMVGTDSCRVDSRTSKKQEEAARSKRVGFDSRTSDTEGVTETFVCHKCGTPLSNNHSLQRHENNGMCSNYRYQFSVAYSE